jgi:hypothetical protein
MIWHVATVGAKRPRGGSVRQLHGDLVSTMEGWMNGWVARIDSKMVGQRQPLLEYALSLARDLAP